MKKYIVLAVALFATRAVFAQLNLTESFATDPIGTNRWHFGQGSNANSQFTWTNSAAAYTGDSPGSLAVHVNSSQPTARLDLGLGVTLDQTTDFTLTTRFSIAVTSAPNDQFAQFAFGLVNSALTGGDRTGSLSNFTSDNFFHTVEFDYFPNEAAGFGRVIQPSVAGGQKTPSSDAFANFAPGFSSGYPSTLGGPGEITELPQNTLLQAVLSYVASSRELTLSMFQLDNAGTLTPLTTGLIPLVLNSANGYDTTHPFSVDTLAIMAYQDGFTSAGAPSLIGDIVFQQLQVAAPATVPEPGAALLVMAGGVWLRLRRR